ncbi:hypothetical protein CR513_24628, partial [Mucuna pruriens]
MVSTPFPTDYIEKDEEALETSFQAFEIVGTTNIEIGRGDIKPSKATIMAAKVLIANDFKPSKGLGRRLDDMANPVAVEENPGRAGLGYSRVAGKARSGRKVQSKQQARASLYYRFVSGGPRDSRTRSSDRRPTDRADRSSRQDKGEETEEEALRELERLLEQKRPKLQSGTEELEIINLGKGKETKEIRISKLILPDFKQRLTELLREYEDIFAWSYRDMPGLDTAIVEHKLPLIPNAISIGKQLRRMKLEVALKIKEEVEKQWKVGFLAMAEYPQWVANIVPVPKKDGKVRMCVDYRDLNRASPKDNFSLPHIDQLVDNTA